MESTETTPLFGGSRPSVVGIGLPTEILEGGVRRLSLISLGLVGTLAAVIVLVHSLHERGNIHGLGVGGKWGYLVSSVLIVLSLGIAAFTRMPRFQPAFVLDIGMVYAVICSYGIAMLEHLTYWPSDEVIRGVSWVCVWVVLFPVMVPATPGKTLLTVIACAFMGPLSYMTLIVIGHEPAEAGTLLGMFLPNGAAVALAMLVSRAFYGLGRNVAEARQMGNYRLEERIGQGGMGEVWRAVHRRLGREAAVKFVRGDRAEGSPAATDTLVRRFEREAAATARLRSAHTVELYDFGVAEGGTLYYVMELLSGMDLKTLVDRFGPLPPGRVVYLLRQACQSLAEAHDRGLIHRDVKPANLFVCALGFEVDFVKVLDFGMVRAADNAGESSLTANGAIGGTPAYFAPEMALGDKEIDDRSDLYSLGCVAYFLLTGELVFEGDTAVKLLMAHLHEKPKPVSERIDGIPPDLDALVLACLEKEPNNRPASALKLAEALGRCECAGEWSSEQARAWWAEHLPEEQAG